MPKCSKCGAEIEVGNGFCSRCGNKAEAQNVSEPQPANQIKPQSVSQSPVAPKKKSTGVKILLGCLIAFVIFSIVGGIIGYILIKKGLDIAEDEFKKAEEGWIEGAGGLEELQKKSEEALENSQQETENDLEEKINNATDSSLNIETNNDIPTKKASKVVEEFMACTLGTVTQQCPSDNKDSVAKEHLTLEMRIDYNSVGFVPLNYCIQDGPSDVRIDSETEAGGFAYVLVSAKYGADDFTPFWNFILVVQDGEWKIKEIQCLNF